MAVPPNSSGQLLRTAQELRFRRQDYCQPPNGLLNPADTAAPNRYLECQAVCPVVMDFDYRRDAFTYSV